LYTKTRPVERVLIIHYGLWLYQKTITELTGVMTAPKGIPVLALPRVNLTLYDQLFLLEADYVAA
jgi:hypothetical protein